VQINYCFDSFLVTYREAANGISLRPNLETPQSSISFLPFLLVDRNTLLSQHAQKPGPDPDRIEVIWQFRAAPIHGTKFVSICLGGTGSFTPIQSDVYEGEEENSQIHIVHTSSIQSSGS